jgi:hypothetical protein
MSNAKSSTTKSLTAKACVASAALVVLLQQAGESIAGFRRIEPTVPPRRNVAEIELCQGDHFTWKNPFRVRSYADARITSISGNSAQAYPNIGSDGSLDVRADLGGAFTPTPAGVTTVDFDVVGFNGDLIGHLTLIVKVIDRVPPCRRAPNILGKGG